MLRRIAWSLALVLLFVSQVALAQLRVTFIDVGQGASVLLEGEEGSVLFDAGRGAAAYDYLQEAGVAEVDLAIASHAHVDHVGGFPRILDQMSVGELWYNGQTHTTATFERFIDAALASSARYVEPSRGETRQYGDLQVEVLHPTGNAANYEGHLHEKNIVVRATYGTFSVMLTGDAEKDVEEELIAAGLKLESTALKMGHHGSRTSTSRSFVNVVRPEIAVYQASNGNQYQHPHSEAIGRVVAAGASVYGTDVHGSVVIETDGTDYDIQTDFPLEPYRAYQLVSMRFANRFGVVRSLSWIEGMGLIRVGETEKKTTMDAR